MSESRISDMEAALAAKDAEIERLKHAVSELGVTISMRVSEIASLKRELSEAQRTTFERCWKLAAEYQTNSGFAIAAGIQAMADAARSEGGNTDKGRA